MSNLILKIVNGSGRATCSICKEIIEKGTLNQLVVEGYKCSVRAHRSCIADWEKIKILEGLDA